MTRGGIGLLPLGALAFGGGPRVRSLDSDARLLALLLISTCVQKVPLLQFGNTFLKPFHIAAALLAMYVLAAKRDGGEVPSVPLAAVVVGAVVVSMADSIEYGVTGIMFKYLVFLVIVLVAYNLGKNLPPDRWSRIIRRVAWACMAVVCVHVAANYEGVLEFAANPVRGHPGFGAVLFGGGVNLEATWMALFGLFFESNPAGLCYLTLSALLSVAYGSRTGMLISVAAFGYVFLYRNRNRGLAALASAALAVVAVAAVLASPLGGVMVDRFGAIGQAGEGGSLGRLRLWEFAYDTFLDAPVLGAGAGNAVPHMEVVASYDYPEDNIHNYPLQVLLDFGAVGLTAFVLLVAAFLFGELEGRFRNPFAAYVAVYLLASFLEFAGADALFGFALGGYFATRGFYGDRCDHSLGTPLDTSLLVGRKRQEGYPGLT